MTRPFVWYFQKAMEKPEPFTLSAEAAAAAILANPSAYSDLASLALAEHAVAVYLDRCEFREAALDAGYIDAEMVDSGSTQVGVAWTSDLIVISARGSSEAGDWFADFSSAARVKYSPPLPNSFTFTNDKGSTVSKRVSVGYGFRQQAKAAAGGLQSVVARLRLEYPAASIAVTGHSLGAALVPLLVADLGNPMVAYAFESPRVGNAAFAAWYESSFNRLPKPITPTYSVVNVIKGEPDVVTRFPRRYWGFRHLGRRVIHAGGALLFGDDAWRAYRAKYPVQWWRPITRSVRSVRAHLGAQLLETLRARL